jgi:uncharacterized protein YkwD
MLRRFPLVFLLAMAAACAPSSSLPEPVPSAPTERESGYRKAAGPVPTSPGDRASYGAPRRSNLLKIDLRKMEQALLAEANAARRRNGAGPLRRDPRLDRAAAAFARELATRQEIDHVSVRPGRATFRQRIHAEGVRARLAGENLARMTASAGSLPDRAVAAWLRSPGHRSNLLERRFTRTGIGIWQGQDQVWYVVQLYATAD